MRKDWTETTLGEIAEVVGGGTPSTTNPAFWDGEVIWLTPTEVTVLDGKVVSDSARKITQAGLRGSGARLLPVGTVILTSRASVGFVALAGTELTTNQGFQSLIPNNDVDSRFLLFWIQHNRNEFQSRSAGSTFKEISKTNVKSICINLPSLDEQKRIVNVVSSVDAYIDALQQQVELARVARNAVLDELLFPDCDDWSQTTIGEFVSIQSGFAFSAKDWSEDGYPVVKINNVRDGKVSLESCSFVSHPLPKGSEKFQLHRGDLLITLTGEIGATGTVSVEGPVFLNQRVGKVIVSDESKAILGFVAYLLSSSKLRSEMWSLGKGNAQLNISPSSIQRLNVKLPPLTEQKRIVEIVSSMDEVIQSTEQAVVDAKALRSGLLSDLLSGNHEIPASYDSLLGVA